MNTQEVRTLKGRGYNPQDFIAASPELQATLRLLESSFFSFGEAGLFRPLLDELQNRDEYCLMADFDAYITAQDKVSEAWRDPARWNRMSILNTARSGKFSSDRAIMDYARNIWNVKPQTE